MSGDEDLSDLLGPDPEPVAPTPPRPGVHTSPAALIHAGGREVLKRSRSFDTHRAVSVKKKKNSPERLQRILDACADMPINNSVCTRAGISVTTLKYWLQKSEDGTPGDGFDVPTGMEEGEGPVTTRFHEAWDSAIELGTDRVEAAMFHRAIGYREVMTFQGRVMYQMDPDMLRLGLTGAEAYLKDEFGAPIPETVEKQDPDLQMFIMKGRRAKFYGDKKQVDLNVRGGVLVVGMTAKTPADLNAMEVEAKRIGRPPVIFEDNDDEDPT
jgi:hypothetical protein